MSSFTLADFAQKATEKYGAIHLPDIGVTITSLYMLPDETQEAIVKRGQPYAGMSSEELSREISVKSGRENLVEVLCLACDKPDTLRAALAPLPVAVLMEITLAWQGDQATVAASGESAGRATG